MENSKKQLKVASILMLVLTAWSLIKLVVDIILFSIDPNQFEGIAEENFVIVKIVAIVFGIFLLIPGVYVGVKGLKFAKNPDSSKAHLIVAFILLIGVLVATITAAINVFKGIEVASYTANLSGHIAENIALVLYIRSAEEISKSL